MNGRALNQTEIYRQRGCDSILHQYIHFINVSDFENIGPKVVSHTVVFRKSLFWRIKACSAIVTEGVLIS